MIRSSPTFLTGMLIVSAALHGAVAWALFSEETVQTEGGSETVVQARLGTSFADFTAGTLAPIHPAPTETTTPTQKITAPVRPQTTPQKPKTATVSAVVPVATPPTVSPTATRPVVAQTKRAAPQSVAALAPTQTHNSTVPERIEPVAPKPPDMLAALEPEAINASPRPQARPDRDRAATKRTAPQGNATRTARAGNPNGSVTASATRQSSGATRSTTAGNAAASNYPGLVMQRISRVRKPRVGASGTATVRFSVSPSGGLANVSVARSSGSPRLDRAALQVIRRAAPFPKTPPGAQRSFQIRIEGRG